MNTLRTAVLDSLPQRFGYVHSISRVTQQRRTLHVHGEGNIMLRHVAEHASQPFSRYSMQELLDLQNLSLQERMKHVERVLHVGISRIIILLQDLPLGFGSVGPIRGVIQDYVQDLRDLRACFTDDVEQFHACIFTIFSRHRGMMGQVARGLFEFQNEIGAGLEPFAGLHPTNCASVSETVWAVRRIETALDEFFTVRTTLRLLIAHSMKLTKESGKMGSDIENGLQAMHAMHELLVRIPDSLRATNIILEPRHVGAVCLDTRPSLILVEAYQHAKYMCKREFNRASQLLVNGMPAKEYLQTDNDLLHMDVKFPYVDIHLYFIFLEVMKNALLTSIRKVGPTGDPPPINASLISGTSLLAENERTVKITDSGEGIRREEVRKVWSYFYSTITERQGEPGSQRHLPLAGRGLGLPVSRALVRYFGGEIDLHSIPRKGTDVYIYL